MRPESLFFLFSPVTRIKGIGAETAKALSRLLPPATAISGASLPIVRDVLFHLPVGLVDRRQTWPLREAPDGAVGTFVVTVDEHLPPKQKRFGRQPYKVVCSNDSGDITLVFFNARDDYVKKALPPGARRVISGRVEHFDYRLQMTHPDIIAPVEKLAEVQKPEPVYPLTVGLTSRRMAKIIDDALVKLPELPEWVEFPRPLRERGHVSFKSALAQAHHPQSPEDLSPLSPARLRLAYDEMLAGQLHLAILRANMQRQQGEIIRGNGAYTQALRRSLPFTLTQGQERVLAEIAADMESGHRMARLLQGDVGSGKTIVALFAMLNAAEQGLQSALMVPTELVAEQHYEVISSLLATLRSPLTTILLTGSVKGAARKAALEKIRSGEAKIVVGTHALFQDAVEFANLALVVIDEQHRFGVNQRMALSAKGNAPHILHMTATPIPRSLTMVLYGDMDVSLLQEKPAGRVPITTRLLPASRMGDVLERLKAALGRGEKAYWICPLIEEVDGGGWMVDGEKSAPTTNHHSPTTDVAAAQSRYAEFKARFGPVVGLVHGRMKKDQRDEEMRKFARGDYRLLVATTVVEVGVDVKDATIMVIEQAERFGLAQLHQLRGRVGRGEKASSCVLLYSPSPLAGEDRGGGNLDSASYRTAPLHPNPQGEREFSRLSILRDSDDGFAIAEADLAQRGGGDLLGVRQSGLPRFIFTHLAEHQSLLKQAREDAGAFLAGDPEFKTPRGEALKLLLQLFGREVVLDQENTPDAAMDKRA